MKSDGEPRRVGVPNFADNKETAMRIWQTIFAMLALATFAVPSHGQDAKSDLPKFQGKWAVVEMFRFGEEVTSEELDGSFVTFTGDKMSWIQKKNEPPQEYTIKLIPQKKSGRIELIPKGSADKDEIIRGTYNFRDRFLTIQLLSKGTDPAQRPDRISRRGIIIRLSPR
ncbi:MAG: TIGR03067 domain-containing protein [Planctomycetes bacterium]|nr:TIGR03067 domain-containing protein [Planctomycetota bacterium]